MSDEQKDANEKKSISKSIQISAESQNSESSSSAQPKSHEADLAKEQHGNRTPATSNTPPMAATSTAQKDQNESSDAVAPKSTSPHPGELFNADPAPRLPTSQTKSTRRWWFILVSLIAIAALLAVAWSAYQQFIMQQNWQDLQSTLTSQLEQQSQNNKLSNTAAQSGLQMANDNQQLLNQQNQLIQQLRQSLTATQERIRELSGRRNQDWMLAEAEYLINLAEYKVTLEKDPTSAIALLKTADEKILAIGDSHLLELRQAIAKDIADLQLVVAPDISGLAARLDALAGQIPQLNIMALEFAPLNADAQEPLVDESSEEFSWESLYQNFLSDFVTIKDHSEPIKPLMTPEQRGDLNANIQLALQQAQIAMLRGEQALYQNNLDNALNWIQEFFKLDEVATPIVQQLTELRQERVIIDLPRQLNAKQQMRVLKQDRLYQWLQSSSVPDNSDDETNTVGQLP